MSRSFFIVSREIFESPIWREDPHTLKLFLYLIGQARHQKEAKRFPHFELKRGELVTSLARIAEENEYNENGAVKRWSRQKVLRIIEKLEKGEYIKRISDTYGTHISICNYETYQDVARYRSDSDGTQMEQDRNTGGTAADIYNNGNKGNNGTMGESGCAEQAPPPPKYSDVDMSNAIALRDAILAIAPEYIHGAKPGIIDLETWAKDFRLIRERDKRLHEDVRFVIDNLSRDEFWSRNIRSPGALRGQTKTGKDKFLTILASVKEAVNGKPKTGRPNGRTYSPNPAEYERLARELLGDAGTGTQENAIFDAAVCEVRSGGGGVD